MPWSLSFVSAAWYTWAFAVGVVRAKVTHPTCQNLQVPHRFILVLTAGRAKHQQLWFWLLGLGFLKRQCQRCRLQQCRIEPTCRSCDGSACDAHVITLSVGVSFSETWSWCWRAARFWASGVSSREPCQIISSTVMKITKAPGPVRHRHLE